MRSPLAVLAVLCCVTATSCSSDGGGSSGSPESSASGDVLEGAELGAAQGSTAEVPFDDSVVDEGEQAALDAPAVVLVPSDSGEETIAARVTIQSAQEGDVDDLQIQGVPAAVRDQLTAYVIEYRVEYVNGPVLRDFQSVYFDLASGGEVVSDQYEEFAAAVDCANFYTVDDFGEGAVLEGCEVLVVGPDRPAPDAVAWTAPVDGAPVPQVTWPLP